MCRRISTAGGNQGHGEINSIANDILLLIVLFEASDVACRVTRFQRGGGDRMWYERAGVLYLKLGDWGS